MNRKQINKQKDVYYVKINFKSNFKKNYFDLLFKLGLILDVESFSKNEFHLSLFYFLIGDKLNDLKIFLFKKDKKIRKLFSYLLISSGEVFNTRNKNLFVLRLNKNQENFLLEVNRLFKNFDHLFKDKNFKAHPTLGELDKNVNFSQEKFIKILNFLNKNIFFAYNGFEFLKVVKSKKSIPKEKTSFLNRKFKWYFFYFF